MADDTQNNSNIMHILGQMQGESRASFQNTSESLALIREDIKRSEERMQGQIAHLEKNVNASIDAVNRRVDKLESQDKVHIKEIARQSAISGSITAAIVSGMVELIKHI